FTSRRRHTRSKRDWSSDVCSSDLNDDFIRTTESRHTKVVQKSFQQLQDQGDIYLDEYAGWYCVSCESLFTDYQLEDGHCPDCGKEVKKVKEESYFFKMSKYVDRQVQYYEENQ